MAVENTGATLPGTGASEDRDGKEEWKYPTNITTEGAYTYCDVVALTYSDWLRASNFGFQIPTGSTINGIVVEINRKGEVALTLSDDAFYLVDASGTNTGGDKASAAKWPTSYTTATYGSSSDMWGADWAPFEVNNSNSSEFNKVSKSCRD